MDSKLFFQEASCPFFIHARRSTLLDVDIMTSLFLNYHNTAHTPNFPFLPPSSSLSLPKTISPTGKTPKKKMMKRNPNQAQPPPHHPKKRVQSNKRSQRKRPSKPNSPPKAPPTPPPTSTTKTTSSTPAKKPDATVNANSPQISTTPQTSWARPL